ncbi:MAG: monovalent cation/H+ antiporter complex subunit F [bacterium]
MSTLVDLYTSLLICVMGVGIVLCIYRLLIGPSLAERTVAGDGALSMIMGIFILVSVLEETGVYLNSVLIIALLGFISTLTVARYLEFVDDK